MRKKETKLGKITPYVLGFSLGFIAAVAINSIYPFNMPLVPRAASAPWPMNGMSLVYID